MSQRVSGYARKPDEAYDTPAWCAAVVAKRLTRNIETIWEPAPGKGQLSRALRAIGYDVVETREDFFTIANPPRCDAIVTNPPFGLRGETAAMFARKAISMEGVTSVALLLRVDYDSAKSRIDLFRDCEMFAGKVIMLDRIKWFPGPSGPSDNHAWYIWNRNHRGAPWLRYQDVRPGSPRGVDVHLIAQGHQTGREPPGH